MGSDTEEMMPPMIAGTRLRSTSCRAWSTATEPWLCESRRSDGELAPGGAACLVDLLKGKLDGFGRSLAEAPGRTGQLHDNADRVRAGLLCGCWQWRESNREGWRLKQWM